jgi:transcriptional regulator with XRE-family HTH domain
MAKSHINHPAIVKFRRLILQDRFKESTEKGKPVRSIEQSKKFGFISNTYFNNIENGRVTPSLETFLDMVDIMGYEIDFFVKQETETETE